MRKIYDNLSEEEKTYIIQSRINLPDGVTVEKQAIRIGDEFGVSERTVRKWWSEKFGLKEKVIIEPEQYEKAKTKVMDKKQKKFIITWAQNNTDVHKKFLTNIEAYAEYINADIHIIAGRYKNPTSVLNDVKDETWDYEIVSKGYLDANRHNIHKYLSVMGDIKIQPTAVNPMSGLQGVSGINSCIFGAPKVQLEMVPVLESNIPKMMLTTGSVTQMNYTDSKAGKKGEFHHTFGFVVVEIVDSETFYTRQVTANDITGEFNDLYYNVNNGLVSQNSSIEAIILGDVHYGQHDQEVIDVTFGLLNILQPEHVIIHDVFDGYSINHHELDDPFIQYGKEVRGENSLSDEIDGMLRFLGDFRRFKKVVIVRSNHDDFLDRWLKRGDWKKQPTTKNSLLYMELSAMLLRQHECGDKVLGVIPQIIQTRYPDFITLPQNASYKVKNWELGQHGNNGNNGSFGSMNQFRTLNSKIVFGHFHTPSRKDGALCVGTSTKLRLNYNTGASSWFQSHVIIHKDGRAQHINFVKDTNNKVNYTSL